MCYSYRLAMSIWTTVTYQLDKITVTGKLGNRYGHATVANYLGMDNSKIKLEQQKYARFGQQ